MATWNAFGLAMRVLAEVVGTAIFALAIVGLVLGLVNQAAKDWPDPQKRGSALAMASVIVFVIMTLLLAIWSFVSDLLGIIQALCHP